MRVYLFLFSRFFLLEEEFALQTFYYTKNIVRVKCPFGRIELFMALRPITKVTQHLAQL